MKRIPSLDGLRALSIALVFTGHTAGTRHFFTNAQVAQAGDLGNLGVRIFFVISGFLITRLLLLELAATNQISLRAFYMRRLLRIFPAAYVFIGSVALLSALSVVTVDRTDLLHAVTYTSNYHIICDNFPLRHLWSLSVEEQFYLIWPFTLAALGAVAGARVLAGVLAVVPILRVGLFMANPEAVAYIGTAFEMVCDALATGCLLALALPRLLEQRWFVRLISSPALPLLAVLIVAANKLSDHPKALWLVGIPFMNVSIALLITRYVQFPRLAAGRILNSRPLVTIGVLSYSLYLWQQLFLIQWRPATSVFVTFPLNVIAAAACGALSYYIVERPFLRLKGHFHPKGADVRAAGLGPHADPLAQPSLVPALNR